MTWFEPVLLAFLATPSNVPYFWNTIALATGDLNNYHGPKSRDELYGWIKHRKHYNDISQMEDAFLLYFYLNLKSPEIQKYIAWVKILAPLVARSDQLPGILKKTGVPELDCYNTIILNYKNFQNPELQYDLLTRVIDKIKPIVETNRIDAEPYKNLYNVARHFRSTCDWAKQSNENSVRETLISDKLYTLRNHQTTSGKLKMTQDIMQLMIDKLEHIIKITPPDRQQSAIRSVCQQAYQYVAYAGAENQKFVNEIWDVFNWRDIVNIPVEVAKQIKR
ncbi:MAG: hypothetical protein ACLRFM_03880 [Alphaproteobacteria bacterium]